MEKSYISVDCLISIRIRMCELREDVFLAKEESIAVKPPFVVYSSVTAMLSPILDSIA